MAYHITDVTGMADENRPSAEFLAAFVRQGGLDAMQPGDDRAEVWQQRMRWWWNENPFCQESSPRGFLLKNEADRIVGFYALIPFEYVVDGQVVPSMVSSSFFVNEADRSASMGVVARQRRIERDYHLIDGSPSPKMRLILDKLKFYHSGDRHQYLFPLRAWGGAFARGVLQRMQWSFPLSHKLEERDQIVTDPMRIVTIPERNDGLLRRRLTRESLAWLSSVGTAPRQFIGLCDEQGQLKAYFIGVYKRRLGQTICLLMDYQDLTPTQDALDQLLAHLVTGHRQAGGLDPSTRLLAWSTLGAPHRSGMKGLKRTSILRYQLPAAYQGVGKLCVPFEGDMPLL